MSSSQTVTYTRLRDGSWGLRGPGLVAGKTVIVTRRGGAPKTEVVGKVLWSGDSVSLATIHGAGGESRSQQRPTRAANRRIVGWDGQVGSSSYYTSGAYDEMS